MSAPRHRDEHGRFVSSTPSADAWETHNRFENALSKVFTILALQTLAIIALVFWVVFR